MVSLVAVGGVASAAPPRDQSVQTKAGAKCIYDVSETGEGWSLSSPVGERSQFTNAVVNSEALRVERARLADREITITTWYGQPEGPIPVSDDELALLAALSVDEATYDDDTSAGERKESFVANAYAGEFVVVGQMIDDGSAVEYRIGSGRASWRADGRDLEINDDCVRVSAGRLVEVASDSSGIFSFPQESGAES